MPEMATSPEPEPTTAATTTPDATAAAAGGKSKVDLSEVQETVSRLAAHKGVTAVLILNRAGDILTQSGQGLVGNPRLLKQTLEAAAMYIQSIPNENNNTEEEDVSEEDALDSLSFVRIRSKAEEILVAPKNQYVLVVLQDPALSPL
eukprot:Nitzschia sp. Nitz4//scaffold44_size153857//112588//113028//NITZ4_002738-RA/size153857-processed-gene-0.133-mRNA-1//1//CDS//3329552208//4290//frame0